MKKSAASSLDKHLGFNANRVSLLLRKELTRALKEWGITPEQWQILYSLWIDSPLNQKDIASITLQDPAALSRIIGKMERKKLVKKIQSKEDRRVTLIHILPAGKKLEPVLVDTVFSHFDKVYSGFSRSDKKLLTGLLLKLRKSIGDIQ